MLSRIPFSREHHFCQVSTIQLAHLNVTDFNLVCKIPLIVFIVSDLRSHFQDDWKDKLTYSGNLWFYFDGWLPKDLIRIDLFRQFIMNQSYYYIWKDGEIIWFNSMLCTNHLMKSCMSECLDADHMWFVRQTEFVLLIKRVLRVHFY